MALILISSERFAEHQTPPGHPECPERADVMDVIASEWRRQGGEVVAPPLATHEQLARVHDAAYLERIAGTAGRAIVLDPDTYTSSETYEIARLAAGAAVDAVERVMGGHHQQAIALVRPPGHHAERGPGHGVLHLQQHRRRGRARRARWARLAWPSSTTTCIMGTARSICSRAVPTCCTSQPINSLTTRALARLTKSDAGAGEGFTINVPARGRRRRRGLPARVLGCRRAGLAPVQARSPARVGGVRRARTRSARRHAADRRRVRGDDHGAAAGGGGVLRGKDGDGDGGRLRFPGADRIAACRRVGAVARPRGGARLADIRPRVAVARPHRGRRREGGARNRWKLADQLDAPGGWPRTTCAARRWARRRGPWQMLFAEHPEGLFADRPRHAPIRRAFVSSRIGEG